MIIGLFALTAAAIFFGAAFYVNFAERRRGCISTIDRC
jgi:hypothetical protein